jgi:hypothetical protein
MADLEIFVVILGDAPASKRMFPVSAPGNMSVGKWREQAYVKKQHYLIGYGPADLALWKVHMLCFLRRPMS